MPETFVFKLHKVTLATPVFIYYFCLYVGVKRLTTPLKLALFAKDEL